MKEAVVASFKILFRNLHVRTEENQENPVRISGLRAEFSTRGFPNTKQEC
jgi:hypothetical protein